jgi:putative heme-binding domain-containing protein
MSYERQADAARAYVQGRQERGSGLGESGVRWAEEVCESLLASKDVGLVQKAAELVRAAKLPSQRDALLKHATRKELGDNERVAVVNSLIVLDAKAHLKLLGTFVGDAGESSAFRERVAQSLAGINHAEARQELVTALATAPAGLANAIAAGLAGNREGADELLKAIAAGKASPRLLQEQQVRVRLQQSRLPDWETRVAKLTEGLPAADQRLHDLLRQRREGFTKANAKDPALGAKVFEKHCAACHQLDGKGAKIGPQLDGIGLRGLDRLLEDLIDPNRNIDQAFRASTLLLKGDRILTGLVLREEGEVLIVADAQGKEQRITKGEIDERNLSQLSPMPANLIDQIPEAEFYQLMAYLLEQRQQEKK